MFTRLAEQYRTVVEDLVLSLQALTNGLQESGITATCYACGDGRDGHGASFVADLGEEHIVRFLVSDFGISWVESRQGSRLLEWLDEAWLPNQLLSKPLSRPSKNIKRLSGCTERHFATRQ